MFEPFYGEIVAGLDSVLAARHIHVLMQVVGVRDEEIACYRRWSEDPRVVGVALTDLSADDARLALIRTSDLFGVVMGEPEDADGMSVVRTDNSAAMTSAVSQLVAMGHGTIGRVSGPKHLVHTRVRTEAFHAATARFGATSFQVEGDYSAASGADATRSLLSARRGARPTAIIYDNDVMAVAGLDLVHNLGLTVPRDLSIVAWDDSTLCRLASQPLSAMSHDINEIGQLAARALINTMDGRASTDVTAPLPVFVPRETTGVPMGRRMIATASGPRI